MASGGYKTKVQLTAPGLLSDNRAMDYWRTSVIMGCLWLLSSCDTRQSISSTNAPTAEQSRVAQPDARQDFNQRQLAFLNRIRDADPQQRIIDRAMLNEQNELGLILDRNVEINRIPDLMRTMLTQMAREFPDQDLTVLAYAPSNPPRKIGTARLDGRTREMSYIPEN
jgi:hypothetical protein